MIIPFNYGIKIQGLMACSPSVGSGKPFPLMSFALSGLHVLLLFCLVKF